MTDEALLARLEALEKIVVSMGELIGSLHSKLASTEAISLSLVVAHNDPAALLSAHVSLDRLTDDALLFTSHSDQSMAEAKELRDRDHRLLIGLIQRGDELREKAQPPSDPGPPQQCGQP